MQDPASSDLKSLIENVAVAIQTLRSFLLVREWKHRKPHSSGRDAARCARRLASFCLRAFRKAISIELELSNNLAENAMRPVALGRRNWIHIGSEEAGPRVAAIVSIVETCRRLRIPIRDYLCSILPGLANFPINRIAELTPASWLARN
jgi:transposase IS66 family protein